MAETAHRERDIESPEAAMMLAAVRDPVSCCEISPISQHLSITSAGNCLNETVSKT